MNVIPAKNYDTSLFDGKSATVVLSAGVPSLPRKQEEPSTQPPLPKPEPSAAQRALVELRSLHGHRHALKLNSFQRTVTGGSSTEGRGRRAYKPGSNPSLMKEITNSRNLYHNDTVKHLMHQLSELNNITYNRIEKGGIENESFCSELTLQPRREENSAEKDSAPHENMTNPKTRGGANNQKSHNVMKLIERQILRDLTHHIARSAPKTDRQNNQQSDTKTHSDELPGGMKVVIKKTTRKDEKSTRKHELSLPSLAKPDSQNAHKRKPEKFEWSLDVTRTTKPLPTLSGVSIRGQTAPEVLEASKSAPSEVPSRRKKTHNVQYSDRTHSSLPKIQEEPDIHIAFRREEGQPATRDVGTNCTPPISKEATPTNDSSDTKVKLPILGKSIGQQRELNYEGGSKFSKPSLHEIKRIIHGLYGDYFDSTLERYYTYEKQLNETKAQSNETDIHYVTPAWDDSQEPAASHTLQLFKSASKRSDDVQYKQPTQAMSVPVIRSKYGQAIATSNKRTPERQNKRVQASERVTYSQPVMRNEIHRSREAESGSYTAFVRDRLPPTSVTPNTPNEKVLRNYIAHQVALYHEQIERENRSLNENSESRKDKSNVHYVTESRNNNKTTSLTQFTEDIDRYAQYLEAYLEAKRKHSKERRAKLQDLKERQREKKQQKNKHLEVVEQRDAFLAQVALENLPRVPKSSANADHPKNSRDDVTFSYAHEDHRYNDTPVVEINPNDDIDKSMDVKRDKQAMGTKIYRIFGERKKSASAIRRWVAQAPVPYTSRAIKRQVPRSLKDATKTLILPPHNTPRHMRQRVSRPRLMTDLVSRFQVATRYKLDRDYVASLASGTS